MPDKNKLAMMGRNSYRRVRSCVTCTHGRFTPGCFWGNCLRKDHEYEHEKQGKLDGPAHVGMVCKHYEISTQAIIALGEYRNEPWITEDMVTPEYERKAMIWLYETVRERPLGYDTPHKNDWGHIHEQRLVNGPDSSPRWKALLESLRDKRLVEHGRDYRWDVHIGRLYAILMGLEEMV